MGQPPGVRGAVPRCVVSRRRPGPSGEHSAVVADARQPARVRSRLRLADGACGRRWVSSTCGRCRLPTRQPPSGSASRSSTDGWYALTNTDRRVGFALAFDVAVFPYLWFWQMWGGQGGSSVPRTGLLLCSRTVDELAGLGDRGDDPERHCDHSRGLFLHRDKPPRGRVFRAWPGRRRDADGVVSGEGS